MDQTLLDTFLVPPVVCDGTGLPTQFILDSANPFDPDPDPDNGGVRWSLDQDGTQQRCSSKGAIVIDPIPVAPAEAAVCLAQLQAHCPAP